MACFDLLIKQPLGICGVSEDTKTLTELAVSEGVKGRRALDIGTGTGYIAITLAKLGAKVDATDISKKALFVARENAKLNKTNVNFFSSNLFEKVDKKYDLVVFNPPISGAPDHLKSLARKIPLSNFFVPFYLSLDKSRQRVLESFLTGAKKHLTPKGRIITTAPLREIEKMAAEKGLKRIKHVKNGQDFVVLSV